MISFKDPSAAKTAIKIVLIYLTVVSSSLLLFSWFKQTNHSSGFFSVYFMQDILFLLLSYCLLLILIYRFAARQYHYQEITRQDEVRYHSLFDNMNRGGSVYRPIDNGHDFILVDINSKGEEIDQIARQKYINKNISDLPPNILNTKLIQSLQRVHTTGVPEHCPVGQYQNNHLKQFRDNYVFRLESGEIVVIYHDITQKKHLEENLRQSREKLTLQNNIITQFLTITGDAVYQQVLRLVAMSLSSSYGLWGYLNNKEQLVTTDLNNYRQQWDNIALKKIIRGTENTDNILGKALQTGKHCIQNSQFISPLDQTTLHNGLVVPVQYQEKTIALLFLGNKEEPYSTEDGLLLEDVCANIAPILEARRQAQYNARLHASAISELKKNEADLKEAEKLAKTGHWEHDLIKNRLHWSDEVYRIFNIDPVQFKPTVHKFLQLIHPEDQEIVRHSYQKAVDNRELYEITHRILLNDGTIKHVHERSITTYNKNNTPIRSLGTVQDITERIEVEAANKRLATAIDQAVDVIVITDTNGLIQYVNPAFEKLTGYTKEIAIGLNPSVLQSGVHLPSFYEDLWATINSGKVWHGRFINKNNAGKLFTEETTITPVKDDSGQIINFVAVKHDISRELELEGQLRHAVKMEAIGTLAGGIAHDFNNILGAMLGYTRMAMEDLPGDSQPYQDLCQVLQSGDRAVNLIKQILLFSRHQEQGFIPVQIQFIIKEAIKMLRASLPASIIIKGNIDLECPPVMADPTQIHQILINLCTNARQAMLALGGDLTINLSQLKLSDGAISTSCNLKPGNYVLLTVKDSGNGIAEEDLVRIFDPFFTTKEIGEGTGLGLAVVHGIVKSHNGNITVESELKTGTTFSIFLPVADADCKPDVVNEEEIMDGGNEHILVVDDEPSILLLRQRLLSRLGYKVSTFSSSFDALESFRKAPYDYDILLTDLTMPKMDGRALTAIILTIRPDFPVILCSGNNGSIALEKVEEYGFCSFLEKPVKPSTLAKTLRTYLNANKNTT